ncbi:hypothetical protein [Dactylosporangium sp. NPDC050588]|uniref:hypothetical protein n=1 Tax=Dactylosporangium sp. NPDC050588 TaxID=3157211 RepID=UPI0033DAFA05
MKRAVRAAAAAVLAGLLLGTSGCGLTVAGVDGELTDDWPPLAAPKFDLPAVGACLGTTTKTPFDPPTPWPPRSSATGPTRSRPS